MQRRKTHDASMIKVLLWIDEMAVRFRDVYVFNTNNGWLEWPDTVLCCAACV